MSGTAQARHPSARCQSRCLLGPTSGSCDRTSFRRCDNAMNRFTAAKTPSGYRQRHSRVPAVTSVRDARAERGSVLLPRNPLHRKGPREVAGRAALPRRLPLHPCSGNNHDKMRTGDRYLGKSWSRNSPLIRADSTNASMSGSCVPRFLFSIEISCPKGNGRYRKWTPNFKEKRPPMRCVHAFENCTNSFEGSQIRKAPSGSAITS